MDQDRGGGGPGVFAIDDEGALTVMSTRLGTRLAGIADAIADEAGRPRRRSRRARRAERDRRPDERVIELERIDDAEAARAFWDVTWAVADVLAVAAVGVVGVPAGVVGLAGALAVEGGTSTGLTGMKGLAERNGWLPPDPDGATFRRDLAAIVTTWLRSKQRPW